MRLTQRNSFAQKIALTSLLAASVAVGLLMLCFLVLEAISSRTQLNTRLETLADVVGQNSTAALSFGDHPAAYEVLNALRAEPSLVAACLYDSSGTLFATFIRQSDAVRCPSERSRVLPPTRDFPSVIRSVLNQREFLGSVLLVSDVQELIRWRKQLLSLAGILLLFALSIGATSGLLLQNKILKPISHLSRAMTSVRERQEYSTRVPVSGRDEIARLSSGFNAMLEELEQREAEKVDFESKLEIQAFSDPLTGLPNRRMLEQRLQQTLTVADQSMHAVAMLYIDLDGFKLVNDSLGHSIGDALLIQVANRFSARVRTTDMLARIGGDEFTVILTGLNQAEDAMIAATSLLDCLARPFKIQEHHLTISASIGISIYPNKTGDGADLMQQADSAMYAAKRNGKNQVRFFTPDLGKKVRERLNLENQLRNALQQKQIHVNYQPEFDVYSGRLVRFEALARWNHPTLGIVPPEKFIAVAEESGLIMPLGAFILEQACKEAAQWESLSAYPLQVAVNVSSIQFKRATFVEEVVGILDRTGLKPDRLQLELTESVMVRGISSIAESMQQLRELNVSFAIDDFGTGYSSLSYLQSLPFSALKIDRSFVRTCDSNVDAEALIRSLISLAQSVGLRVIVEGVETEAQLDIIRKLSGDEVQGYLLGRPNSDPISTILFMNQEQKRIARALSSRETGIQRTTSPTNEVVCT